MTHADINDLETRDYVFKIGDRGKGIQARYDENTDALIFPRAAFDYVYKLLKEALSQEQKWIPVSERLPEKDDLYLIYFDDGEYELDYFSRDTFNYSGVIAWMPLPKPYEPQE